MIDLSTELAGVKLKNPTVLSSGILGTSASVLKRVVKSGAGAVITKSIGPVENAGWKNPVVIEFEAGLLNAVGLPSPGYKNMSEELSALKKLDVPWIASVYAGSVDEFVEVTSFVDEYNPAMIELNLSCPNTKFYGQVFGKDPEKVFEVVSAVKDNVNGLVMPKLTPNTNDISLIARKCEEAGADAISAINTVGPGMLIDINSRKPILSFKSGGVSGPAIRPIAIHSVYSIYENVSIPILGIGGVSKGEHALEMLMAGASAVGIGSGVYYEGINVFEKVNHSLKKLMEERGFSKIKEVIGVAHE